MNEREALKLALEALEIYRKDYGSDPADDEAITAIREALAQPAQRKPLTDEEIETYRYMIDWTASWSYINFARAIESAHGIKE